MFSLPLHAARFVVEVKHPLTQKELLMSKLKIERFSTIHSDYFSRLYVVESSDSEVIRKNLSGLKSIEPVFGLTKSSIIPVEKSLRLVKDDLFVYQWGLLNQGQTLIREKDDIHNLPIKGILGKDIGWDLLLKDLSKESVIVAVLDSGVDLNHPELKDHLWRNDKECGLDPKVDHDGNELPGDCTGWNFTEPRLSDEAKTPTDLDGHGTHVAGIIAAANNDSGTVGVNPNALIMAIKVLKDSNSKSDVANSDSFARGILYAIQNGARVINMSLGWPRSLETKYLREAVQLAISKGIIIVAAAGNNNSSEPLFPCAYDGVLCVAASTIQGHFAGFSNFGGHVDTIAPGEGILSSIPSLFEPEFFAIPGYDIKSGTSQATPYVAGLISVLLTKNKTLSFDEVFARFYQLESNPDQKKYILGGDATWIGLNQEVMTSVIRPVLKRVRQILLKDGKLETKIAIPLRNYGLDSSRFTLKLESLTPGLEILNVEQNIDPMKHSEFRNIVFDIRVTDLLSESNGKIQVTVIDGDRTHSFINELPIVRDVRSEVNFKKYNLTYNENAIPLGVMKDGDTLSLVTTLSSYGESSRHEFYLQKSIKTNDLIERIELTVFSRIRENYVQAKKILKMEKAINILNFMRVDLNRDGIEDYFIQSLAQENEKKYLVFSFYDQNMNDLWPTFQNVKFELDVIVKSITDINFLKFDHPKLGKMLLPAFFTQGQIPSVDQVLTNWDRPDQSSKNRLYYLEVTDDLKFRVRTLTTKTWEEKLKDELKLKWYETVRVEQILPVSKDDARNGELRLLVTAGHLSRRATYIFKFNLKNIEHGVKLPQLVLQSDKVDPVYSITQTGLSVSGEAYFNIYDRLTSKLVQTEGLSQRTQFIYRHEDTSDFVAGHLVSFTQNNKDFSIIQTKEKLISIAVEQGQTQISFRPKLRYSFLSQKLLSEMYYPVIFKRNGVSLPALYVDSTAVTDNRLNLLENQNGKLVSSIKNSLLIPAGCFALNPFFNTELDSHEFIFGCLETNGWVIRTFGMN